LKLSREILKYAEMFLFFFLIYFLCSRSLCQTEMVITFLWLQILEHFASYQAGDF